MLTVPHPLSPQIHHSRAVALTYAPTVACCSRMKMIMSQEFYVSFNSISVISGLRKGDHERRCAVERRLGSKRISLQAGLEPATPWSEVGSGCRSATRTLRIKMSPNAATPTKLKVRMCGCPGWSESSMGAQIILLVLAFCGLLFWLFSWFRWIPAKSLYVYYSTRILEPASQVGNKQSPETKTEH